MDEQLRTNKARIYGYVIGLTIAVVAIAWKLIAR